jgi:hypothetical protein
MEEAMIGIAIKARRVEDNGGKDPDDFVADDFAADAVDEEEKALSELDRKIKQEIEKARLRVIEEYDIWNSIPSYSSVYYPQSIFANQRKDAWLGSFIPRYLCEHRIEMSMWMM